jgi:uncharacterized protein
MKFPVTINGQRLTLHTSGAAFLEERRLLLISDVHLGKVTHFRKHGVALPSDAAAANFRHLTDIADLFEPETICFLGDLFHSDMNREWETFAAWAAGRSENLLLVSGNHDVLSPKAYASLGIVVTQLLIVDHFLLTHLPEEYEGLFTICGHVHPGVRLYGPGRQMLRLPCFFQSEKQLILPAFGTFTGKHFLRPGAADTAYVIAGEEIIQVKIES